MKRYQIMVRRKKIKPKQITTMSVIPCLEQYFSKDLLSLPTPLMRDTSRTLWDMYQFIKVKLLYKARHNPIQHKKCLDLEQKFLELYEQAQIKEEELKEKTEHRTQRSFYYIKLACEKNECLYQRYEYKRLQSRYFKNKRNNGV